MSKKHTVDLSQDRLYSCWAGLIYGVVCAPKSWPPEKVSEEATRMNPPGTTLNKWVVSHPDEREGSVFDGTNCVPCPDSPDRVHWLVNC